MVKKELDDDKDFVAQDGQPLPETPHVPFVVVHSDTSAGDITATKLSAADGDSAAIRFKSNAPDREVLAVTPWDGALRHGYGGHILNVQDADGQPEPSEG